MKNNRLYKQSLKKRNGPFFRGKYLKNIEICWEFFNNKSWSQEKNKIKEKEINGDD